MADYQNSRFSYGGLWYSLLIQLFPPDGDPITLDNNALGHFEYFLSMNELTYFGSLEYADITGRLDSVFKGGRCVCCVLLRETDRQDGQEDEYRDLCLFFQVDSVSILERGEEMISYRIDLIGSNVEQCMANLQYTNYGGSPVQCFDILKACVAASGQEVVKPTFDLVKSDVSIRYATGVNDNLYSVVSHLLDKMYSYGEKD